MTSGVEERSPSGVEVSMVVLEAIRTRRSIGKVGPERPPREAIQQILDAATWAPTHHKTQPWRFYVLAGRAREALGEVMAECKAAQVSGSKAESKVEKARRKPLRAPVIVAVAVQPSRDEDVVEIEEIAATSAAVQNMLLAAHAMGLGAIWRTGDPCYDPKVQAFFGLQEPARLLGFVYLGYPAVSSLRGKRIPAEELTVWLGWEDELAEGE
ncbi:nitroreductase family protein [Nitrolancea hollandica]|uniref:Putative NAD(P)H nitroreductase n=1 Tax=Nitrolancea hollandica Lb TaxID=1129897 RepID=I4EM22_9BACT|nr:nitroreductase [Nitrolancea hollandica]CCF85735.1 putative NAD(P)H nitroreductase [Nitrolancea hollandica Lb]